jgi:uncharacterized membrane protein
MMMGWYFLAIIASILFALEALIVKHVSKVVIPESIAACYFLFGSILLLSYAFLFHKFEVSRIFSLSCLPFLILLGVIASVGVLLTFVSYKIAPNVGYVRAIISLSIILAYLLSFPLFGAKFNIYGLVAIILIIAGTLLFIKVE